MNIQASSQAIRDRFKTLVATPKSLPTQYDNKKFTRPEDSMFARFTIRPGDIKQKSIGVPTSNRFRVPGVWIAQLFAPIETGDKDLNDLADFIILQFINVGSGPVTYFVPSAGQVGRAGKYWQLNVTGEWFADKIT